MMRRREPRPRRRFRELALGRGRLDYANFTEVLAQVFGERTVFHLDRDLAFAGFGPRRVSYEEMARIVARLSAVLEELGTRPGDRVGIMALNRVEAVFANFAAARIGAVPVPMNFMLRAPEVEYVLANCGAETLVCDTFTFTENLGGDPANVPSAKTIALLDEESGPDGVVPLPPLVAVAPESYPPYARRDQAEVATIFYTSGTTGHPKGATLSDRAVCASLRRVGALAACGPLVPQLALLVMPVAHTGGYQNMLLNIVLGTPMFFVSRFRPEAILDLLEKERPTMFVGSPAMYRMLEAAGAAKRDLSSVWVWGGGSDSFDAGLVARFRRYGHRGHALFVRGYGMTEANSYVAMTPPWPVREERSGESCIGWLMPGVKGRVMAPGSSAEAGPGEVGELQIKGVSLMDGYWGDTAETAAAIDPDGWYATGDWVRRGRYGLLFYVDRAQDVIKTGGYKVSSAEIEAVLHSHPAVEYAAAVGAPHATKGEVPVAAVTLKAGLTAEEGELLAWARERLAPYKCPRQVHMLASMPLTFSMKAKKAEVRRLIAEA